MLHEVETNVGKSVFQDYSDGEKQTSAMFGRSGVFLAPKHSSFVSRFIQHAAKPDCTILDCFGGSGSTAHAVIDLNRKDGGNRKYILVEMGGYFDTVMKPRIQKVIYSKDWRAGKPITREGTSHIFKYMTMESYEDTLNNLSLRRTSVQDDLIKSDPALREEYMLSYMLDFETKGSPSLLDLDSFEDPLSYKLNITRGDETRPESVDLVDTFNYLLGLTVSRMYSSNGYRVVEGIDPADERVLVIWRNTHEKSNEDLDTFFEEQGYAGAGFDRVYANGDNPLALKAGDSKVHLIEEEFRRLMFEMEGA
jgi:adenine-specific DNA-methyltransferase